jgi:hypothetical protein
VCDSCQLAKNNQLPYHVSTSVSTIPLEQAFSDVWGPPHVSIGKHSNYVTFIDDFSKFTWIYLIKKRSSVYQIFLNFQQLVEHKFDSKPIGVVNMREHNGFFKKLASHIMFLVHMHINKWFC